MKTLASAALVVFAALLSAALPASAADGGWQKGCAYKLPSGAMQSGSAMIVMYCPMLAACQKMMDEGHPEMMAPMACYGFSPSTPAADQRPASANRELGASPASRQRNRQ